MGLLILKKGSKIFKNLLTTSSSFASLKFQLMDQNFQKIKPFQRPKKVHENKPVD